MKFGVYPPIGWHDYLDHSVQTAILETAKLAEDLGYDGIWANDVVVVSNATYDTFPSHVIEPLITLASLIHFVPNINLGVSILQLPQRNIFLLAKQAAALDLYSGGRFRLGVGLGHRQDEFRLMGADFANRGAIADEEIQVLQQLWHEPDVSFDGQFHKFSNARLYPKPTNGGPPLWIGGNSRAAIRRAAKFGDAWVPFGETVDKLNEGVTLLHDLTEGRPTPLIAMEMSIRVITEGKPKPEPRLRSNTDYETTIEGTSEEIVQALQAYQKVGLDYVICIFYAAQIDDLLDQIQIFAEQVMPYFSDTV